ncbi:hypothetical protein DCC81_05525 [Chitinophaga parva]|uniref:Cytochrome c domain-containing protein n=1 Tax=Chitinophaga parva TaxID=2169414 RepID=A0A2T7BMN1_9BACT|nr:hypothetical protein [Chitinophaga parva]PUZ28934.1 hypothetical protein DCC81_05525 [Chitinophaga parva]
MKKIAGSLLLLTFALGACMKGISPTDTAKVDAAMAKYPDTPGKPIYVSHCAHCHKYQLPEYHTADQWVGIINKMAVKAKLSDDQKSAVLAFVQANAKK